MISSSSAINLMAWALAMVKAAEAEAAATLTATRASDFFTISFCLSLAFDSTASNFALSLRQVSLKRSLFFSRVIDIFYVAVTYIVLVELGVEEVVPALRSFFEGIMANL